jgi:membrane protein
MASIKDFPKVTKKLGWGGLGKRVWSEVQQDDVFTWGSALAYAWIFAIFPFLVFLLTLAPYLPGDIKARAESEIAVAVNRGLGGGEAAKPILDSVNQIMHQEHGGLLSIGILLAVWGSSGGMSMTMSALDKAYYVKCTRSFIKQRATAIALTVGVAVLVLLVLLLMPVGNIVTSYLQKHGKVGTAGVWVINILRYAIAICLLFLVVACIYYFGPCIKQKWQTITPGAMFTVAVWIVLGFAFGIYVKKFGNFNKTYGALGGAIILLLFFYINAIVLLIGAELNSVIDFASIGAEPGTTTDFTRVAQAAAEGGEQAAKAEKRQAEEEAVIAETTRFRPQAACAAAGGGGNKWLVVPAFFAVRWAVRKIAQARRTSKAWAID